jgi:hypothetical protein
MKIKFQWILGVMLFFSYGLYGAQVQQATAITMENKIPNTETKEKTENSFIEQEKQLKEVLAYHQNDTYQVTVRDEFHSNSYSTYLRRREPEYIKQLTTILTPTQDLITEKKRKELISSPYMKSLLNFYKKSQKDTGFIKECIKECIKESFAEIIDTQINTIKFAAKSPLEIENISKLMSWVDQDNKDQNGIVSKKIENIRELIKKKFERYTTNYFEYDIYNTVKTHYPKYQMPSFYQKSDDSNNKIKYFYRDNDLIYWNDDYDASAFLLRLRNHNWEIGHKSMTPEEHKSEYENNKRKLFNILVNQFQESIYLKKDLQPSENLQPSKNLQPNEDFQPSENLDLSRCLLNKDSFLVAIIKIANGHHMDLSKLTFDALMEKVLDSFNNTYEDYVKPIFEKALETINNNPKYIYKNGFQSLPKDQDLVNFFPEYNRFISHLNSDIFFLSDEDLTKLSPEVILESSDASRVTVKIKYNKQKIVSVFEFKYDSSFIRYVYVLSSLISWYIKDKILKKQAGQPLLSNLDYEFLVLKSKSIGAFNYLYTQSQYKNNNNNIKSFVIPGGISSIKRTEIDTSNDFLKNSDNGLELINSIEKLHFILREPNKKKKAFESFDGFRIIKDGIDSAYKEIKSELEKYTKDTKIKLQDLKSLDWSKTYDKLTMNKSNGLYNNLLTIQYFFSREENKTLIEKLKKIDIEDIDTLATDIDFEKYQKDKMEKFEQSNPLLNSTSIGSDLVKIEGKSANGLGKPDDRSIEKLAGVKKGVLGGAAAGGAVGIVNQYFQEKEKSIGDRQMKIENSLVFKIKKFFKNLFGIKD